MRRIGTIGLVWIALAISAFADDFDAVVKGIESHYGVHQVSPRLIGFASFFAKPAMWGSGTGGLRIAAFEGNAGAIKPSMQELDQVMVSFLNSTWQPFVHVNSQKEAEAVVIYTTVEGKNMTMLIGSLERSGISLVQIRLNPAAFEEWRENIKDKAKNASRAH
jgi:hypothetical protein